MVDYKIKDFMSIAAIVSFRRCLKDAGKSYGKDYISVTYHNDHGHVTGYRIYYDLDDEKIVWLKLHGIIS